MKKLIFIIFLFLSLISKAQTNVDDSLALVDLYWATEGPNWNNNDNWLTGPVGTWFGIIKGSPPTDTTRVVNITMQSNNLNGIIPASIGNLTTLYVLELYDNNLKGTIPYTIGRCTNFTIINLSNNQLSGNLTDSICKLTNLWNLFISNNNFTGNIPDSIILLPHGPDFRFNNNQFDGLPDFSSAPDDQYQYTSVMSTKLCLFKYLFYICHQKRWQITTKLH